MDQNQINEIHDLLITIDDKVNNGLAKHYENTSKKLISAAVKSGQSINLTPDSEIQEIKRSISSLKNHLGFNQTKEQIEEQIEFIVESFPDDYAPRITELLRLNLAGYPYTVTRNYIKNQILKM